MVVGYTQPLRMITMWKTTRLRIIGRKVMSCTGVYSSTEKNTWRKPGFGIETDSLPTGAMCCQTGVTTLSRPFFPVRLQPSHQPAERDCRCWNLWELFVSILVSQDTFTSITRNQSSWLKCCPLFWNVGNGLTRLFVEHTLSWWTIPAWRLKLSEWYFLQWFMPVRFRQQDLLLTSLLKTGDCDVGYLWYCVCRCCFFDGAVHVVQVCIWVG